MQHHELTERVKSLGQGEAFFVAAYTPDEMTSLGREFYDVIGVPTEIGRVENGEYDERVETIPDAPWRTLVFGTYDPIGEPITTLVVVDSDEKEAKVMEMADDAPLIARWTKESFATVDA